MKRILVTLLLAAFAAGGPASPGGGPAVAAEATHPVLKGAHLPALIPARDFFLGRSRSWAYVISPDGRKLAWFERGSRRTLLHVRTIDDGAETTIRLRRPGRGLRWAFDNRRLLFLRDFKGDENDMLFVVDSDDPGAPPRRLTPAGGIKTIPRLMLADDPAHMLVMMNQRDRSLFDLQRLDIRTGAVETVEENPGDVLNWVIAADGRALARYRRRADGDWQLEARDAAKGRWKALAHGGFDERHWLPFPLRDGRHAYGFSERGRDKTALVRVDLGTGTEEVVYSHPDVEVDRFWFDRDTDRLLMAQTRHGYPGLHFFDAALGADLKTFEADGPADIRIRSRSRDLMRLVVRVGTDRTHNSFYLLDRRTGKKTLLAADPIARYRDILSPMKPVSFTARDGLMLHGYLTIPAGTDGRNLPMVLNVHGGPWSRHVWEYDQLTQFFANRGYAVLTVNYRGSTGYGRTFRQAIRREFARKAHDDLIDGVNWAIARGIADPAKIAIYGRSYGGYATLVGLTFTPEVFAAGIDVVGVADFVGNRSGPPAYWKLGRHWQEYLGDPSKPEDRADMEARSPINFVDRIRRPLLVVHGANDVRVTRENSDRLVAAMRAAGKPVEYLLFDDDGHRIGKPKNRLTMARHMEAFLARHLGGRSEE